MSFKDMVARDLALFLNTDEFGETRTIVYDGERYEDIPVVLTSIKEKDRVQLISDHAQGLYVVSMILHCAQKDLGGEHPEKGQKIRIYDEDGTYYKDFYIGTSGREMGMLRLELEAIDE